MSGRNPGGQPNLVLKSKQVSHPGHGVKSEKFAAFSGPVPTDVTGIKLGVRVKTGQTPDLRIVKQGTSQALTLTPLAPNDPVVDELTSTLGVANDEKWVAYTTSWAPSFGRHFETTLTLDPFETIVPDNGFQVITVAFCHDTQHFTDGVYSYAVSTLPGKNSTGFPVSLALSQGGGKKKTAGKKKSAGKKKGAAKKQGAAKKKRR